MFANDASLLNHGYAAPVWICPDCRSLFREYRPRCDRDNAPLAEVKAHQVKARYPLLGKVVDGRYHLIGGLGQGGLGTVYLAQHRHLEQLFAVKFLDLETVGIDADKRQRKEYQTDFMKEAKVASMIRHESVVKVIDFGEFEGLPYLVMEYVPGPSLLQMITERGRFSVPEATNIALCIARALSAFHERQLVHRDLKPANVILDPRGGGQLTLVDLGLVKDISGPAGRASTHPTALRGTPGYLAPEQVPGWVLSGIGQQVTGGKKLVDARVDIYALGVIFYEMLAGVSPYPDGSNTSIIIYACTKPPLPITGVEPPVRLIPGLEALIYDTMARDPIRRPQSANAFINRLENLSRVPSPRESWPVMTPDSASPAMIQPIRSHHRVVPSKDTRARGAFEPPDQHQTDAIDLLDDDPFYTAHDGATSLQDLTVEFDEDSVDGYTQNDYLKHEARDSLQEPDDFAVTRIESLNKSSDRQPLAKPPQPFYPGPRSVSSNKASSGSMLTWIVLPLVGILVGATVWYFGFRPTNKTAGAVAQPPGLQTVQPVVPDRNSPALPLTPVSPVPGKPVAPSRPKATPQNEIVPSTGPTGQTAGAVNRLEAPSEKRSSAKMPNAVNRGQKQAPPEPVDAPPVSKRIVPKVNRTSKRVSQTPTPSRPAKKSIRRSKRSAPSVSLSQLEKAADQFMKRQDWKGCFSTYSKWLKNAGPTHSNYYRFESRMALCRSKMKSDSE